MGFELIAGGPMRLETKERVQELTQELERRQNRCRELEARLRQLGQQYQDLVENAVIGIFQNTPEGRYISANQALADIYGYDSPQELMARITDTGTQLFVDPNRRKEWLRWIQEKGFLENFEAEIYRKDGSTTVIAINTRGVKDEEGRLLYLEGMVEDIGPRKRAEKALTESEERYRTLVENLPVGVYRCTPGPEGRFLMANPAFLNMFGYDDLAELQKIHVSDIYVEPGERIFFSDSVLTEKKVIMSNRKLKRRDGTPLWGKVTARLITPETKEGRPYFDCVIEDISEQTRAEEALRANEKKFRELSEMLPEAIFEADTAGRITFGNRKVCEYFQVNEADFQKGLELAHLIIPDERPKAAAMVEKILVGEEEGLHEFTGLRRDGETFPLIIHASLIRTGERSAGLRGFLLDISDRKRLENQLLQAQKMEAIGTLAGGIAHDFNNLLMGIQGRTSLMLMDTEEFAPAYEHLKGIEEYVKSAADLTKQLLGFAQGGKYDVRPIDLNRLAGRSAQLFGRTRKEINLHTEFYPDLWMIEADAGQIEQVLMNLLVNAWQAMPQGGDIHLKTTNVSIDREALYPLEGRPGNFVSLTVTDTGQGIEETVKARIFEPFFTTKGLGRGTGLGLASAYGIVKSHGGFFSVESQKGQGASFQVYLPASEKIALPDPSLEPDLHRGNETILLVDDEEMILSVGRAMLERLGYRVLTASGGVKAAARLQADPRGIDLVILDMVMPNVSGDETFQRLRAINPEIKVLLASGYSLAGRAEEIFRRGCRGFIQKPFNLENLSQKVREALAP